MTVAAFGYMGGLHEVHGKPVGNLPMAFFHVPLFIERPNDGGVAEDSVLFPETPRAMIDVPMGDQYHIRRLGQPRIRHVTRVGIDHYRLSLFLAEDEARMPKIG